MVHRLDHFPHPAPRRLRAGGEESRKACEASSAVCPASALQALAFLVVLTFCLAVPAATLYYGANLKPVVSAITDGDATSVDYLTLVCRTMQLVLISIAALLPALLYYQFDRDRLSTLREKFEQQIFRLDRTMKTSLDIDAKYGRQIDEIYGRQRPATQASCSRATCADLRRNRAHHARMAARSAQP